MNISITRSVKDQNALAMQMWKLQARPNIIYTISTFIFGSLALIAGHASSFLVAIAVFVLLVSAFYLSNIIKSRRAISAMDRANSLIPMSEDRPVKIDINDTGIKYEDPQYKLDLAWPLVKFYRIADNLIVLMTSKSYLSAYVIYRSELTNEEFFELEKFLNANVPSRK